MFRPSYLLALPLLAACATDVAVAPQGMTAISATAAAGVEQSVTGHTENTFITPIGTLLRNASFSARRLPNGDVQGNFQITLQGSARLTGDYPGEDGTRPVHFQVECLVIDGNKAWIGGRIIAPKTDRWAGYTDVWYLEDGGKDGPDRLGGHLGRRASDCALRPNIGTVVSEHSGITITDK